MPHHGNQVVEHAGEGARGGLQARSKQRSLPLDLPHLTIALDNPPASGVSRTPSEVPIYQAPEAGTHQDSRAAVPLTIGGR